MAAANSPVGSRRVVGGMWPPSDPCQELHEEAKVAQILYRPNPVGASFRRRGMIGNDSVISRGNVRT